MRIFLTTGNARAANNRKKSLTRPDQEKGAIVLGVNADSVESHKKFMEEHGLPFTLLSDTEKEVLQAYDVWKERTMSGRPVMAIERSTYLILEIMCGRE